LFYFSRLFLGFNERLRADPDRTRSVSLGNIRSADGFADLRGRHGVRASYALFTIKHIERRKPGIAPAAECP
jgi:hypothetical protein